MIVIEKYGTVRKRRFIPHMDGDKKVWERSDVEIPLIRTYSSTGHAIKNVATGKEYAAAIDPADSGREYVETDKLIKASDITPEEFMKIMEGII